MPAALDFEFSPQRVKEIRIRLGLTVAEFAERLGVNPNTVTRWENGHNPPRRGPQVKALLDAEAEASNGG